LQNFKNLAHPPFPEGGGGKATAFLYIGFLKFIRFVYF